MLKMQLCNLRIVSEETVYYMAHTITHCATVQQPLREERHVQTFSFILHVEVMDELVVESVFDDVCVERTERVRCVRTRDRGNGLLSTQVRGVQ